MNKDELLNVLNTLDESKDSVILLDGRWGSGKTHLLNEFIKKYKKHPIYYVSLLGKRNVDDINTSLYMEVHRERIIENVVPSSVSPFSNIPTLDYALKIKEGCSYIVILDDLERYASSHYDEFLSYVSSLVLKGVKVIVVSNLSYLGSGEKFNFDMYKEKIFDHIYKTDLFSEDVLERKFGIHYKYFDESLINLLNSNIRIVDKVESFLENIDKILLNNFPRDNNYKTLLYYVIVLLTTIYNDIPLSYPSLRIKGTEADRKYIFSKINAEEDAREVFKVYDFSLNLDSNYKLENPLDLIIALYNFYVYAKKDYLISYYQN